MTDSFKLSCNDPIAVARTNLETQPEQTIATSQARTALARFLEDQSDVASLKEVKDIMRDKVLTQFPIFSLNEDYMRAITLVIMDKLEKAQTLVNQISSTVY